MGAGVLVATPGNGTEPARGRNLRTEDCGCISSHVGYPLAKRQHPQSLDLVLYTWSPVSANGLPRSLSIKLHRSYGG